SHKLHDIVPIPQTAPWRAVAPRIHVPAPYEPRPNRGPVPLRVHGCRGHVRTSPAAARRAPRRASDTASARPWPPVSIAEPAAPRGPECAAPLDRPGSLPTRAFRERARRLATSLLPLPPGWPPGGRRSSTPRDEAL